MTTWSSDHTCSTEASVDEPHPSLLTIGWNFVSRSKDVDPPRGGDCCPLA